MPRHYTVSDGELVLFLWPAEEGGYGVTSPLDPALITQAETLEEAFLMAHDAWNLLNEFRAESGGPSGDTDEPMTSPNLEKPGREALPRPGLTTRRPPRPASTRPKK